MADSQEESHLGRAVVGVQANVDGMHGFLQLDRFGTFASIARRLGFWALQKRGGCIVLHNANKTY